MAPSIAASLGQTLHHHSPSSWNWHLRGPTDLDTLLSDLSHWELGKAWRDIGGAGALGAVGGTLEVGLKGFGGRVPGLRGGATFLSTLRENIQLSTLDSVHDLPPSPHLCPLSLYSYSYSSPPYLSVTQTSRPTTSKKTPPHSRSGSSTASAAAAACLLTMSSPAPPPSSSNRESHSPAPLPELATHLSTSPDGRPAILKLVADSIAQQRQTAAKALIFHPVSIFLLGIVLALQAQYLNPAKLLTTFGGTVMAFLVAIRGYTGGYITAAENVNSWEWLVSDTAPSAKKQSPRSSSSTGSITATSTNNGSPSKRARKNSNDTNNPPYQVYVTHWGSELIGALVLRISKRDRTAYVRAWTVKNKYRGKGVGKALLEDGVKGVMGLTGNNSGETVGIGKIKSVELEDTHTGSLRIFPETVFGGMIPLGLNRVFDKREDSARRAIEDVLSDVMVQQREKGKR